MHKYNLIKSTLSNKFSIRVQVVHVITVNIDILIIIKTQHVVVQLNKYCYVLLVLI